MTDPRRVARAAGLGRFLGPCATCGPSALHYVRTGRCCTCYTAGGVDLRQAPERMTARRHHASRYAADCPTHGRVWFDTRRGRCTHCETDR